MFLIDDNDKLNTGTVSISDAVKKIFSLAVTNGGVTFLGNKLPVDEGRAFSFKAVLQRVEQILCMTMGSKLTHFLSALFFQIALARTKPDKRSSAVDLGQILLNKVDENNRLTGAGGRLHGNCLFGSAIGHNVQQLDNCLFLKIEKVDCNAVYHVSPTSFSSKLK